MTVRGTCRACGASKVTAAHSTRLGRLIGAIAWHRGRRVLPMAAGVPMAFGLYTLASARTLLKVYKSIGAGHPTQKMVMPLALSASVRVFSAHAAPLAHES